ncbi:MAG TPA: winged helix-turn-helix domain-containing protein [Pyrinomonadaceae bacterium]|nr:winged helix-turn-helix domain-containing protein [Pyrinomonadaceae bacterium]
MPDLNIRIEPGADETKTAQIFNQIASAILAGKFNSGDALVSERVLAEQLGVSRNIVRNAYLRLEEQGLIETAGTSGRRVRVRRGARRATGGAHVESGDRAAARGASKGTRRG